MKRERTLTYLTLLSLSLFSTHESKAAKDYSVRKVLASSLQESLCQKQFDEDELHEIAWSQGIYDAAIEVRMINRKDKGALSTGKLRAFAIWQMKQNYHHGFGFGKCSKERAFTLSVPSRKAITFAKNGKSLSLPMTRHSCKRVYAQHVAEKGGLSKKLKFSRHGRIKIAKLDPGMLSISCQPKHPKWLGPILWFLVPIKLKQFPEVPSQELFSSTQNAQQQLQTWVNHVRRHESLVPLNFTKKVLKDAASELAVSKMLFHDRSVMKQVKSTLKGEDLKPLGEDRAKASTLPRIAWLLWHSPAHRDLILNKDADLAGMSLSKEGGQYFMVLMTAQSEKVTVSKKYKSKK
ncbi:MAG: hypothetical protein HRU09_13160 [Oligoflexales bacterium]|nr:hypothetical protein [Oligoflexales bacterium]